MKTLKEHLIDALHKIYIPFHLISRDLQEDLISRRMKNIHQQIVNLELCVDGLEFANHCILILHKKHSGEIRFRSWGVMKRLDERFIPKHVPLHIILPMKRISEAINSITYYWKWEYTCKCIVKNNKLKRARSIFYCDSQLKIDICSR